MLIRNKVSGQIKKGRVKSKIGNSALLVSHKQLDHRPGVISDCETLIFSV